jgi:hypothetical protein
LTPLLDRAHRRGTAAEGDDFFLQVFGLEARYGRAYGRGLRGAPENTKGCLAMARALV